MIRCGVYQTASGKFLYEIMGTEAHISAQQLDAGQAILVLNDEDIRTTYVLNGTVTERQPFPFTVDKTTLTADGVDEVVVSGVPVDTSVTWPDGQTDTVTDGEVRFSVDLAGTYTLSFSAIPYLDQEVTLEAVAAA